ncbi:MAG: 50S ribosomal protein L11 methyltransferase [Bacteroidetes bacterium]|uniref:Ribosomal protein L11 methyltransferase n=1 Tax=Candidatus Cryptobacteroides faecigallinarum TaxID=2840763 RepID=A0A9D9IJX4_9BACT|nr:50S ribosomal protein L11 methyltransferase [Candidatus Cryptobacteroides faecigallinarum]
MNSQEYIEVSVKIEPYTEENAEIMMAEMEDLPFESFTEEAPYLKCYIPKEKYDPRMLKLLFSGLKYDFSVDFSATLMPQINWNAVWESQFSPIVVDGLCTIKATFHKGLKRTRFNITIDPKMAFGTGHHQTTYMMCRALLKHEKDIKGKVVMDMGCGTAILAILAAKMGAAHTYGIDIDAVAAVSAFDNARMNRISRKVETYCGDASLLQRGKYDILLANINRNILLEDIPTYSVSLRKGGLLFVSGFYTEDLPMICSVAQRSGLEYMEDDSMDNWCCAGFRKL